jgi:hypothetical protein
MFFNPPSFRLPGGLDPIACGVLVGPPPPPFASAIKNKMSSKEHIQLGWVVRWVLSTPPGHPAAGWCFRFVSVLPLLLCTRPARARPSIGGQSPPPPAPRSALWSKAEEHNTCKQYRGSHCCSALDKDIRLSSTLGQPSKVREWWLHLIYPKVVVVLLKLMYG